MSENALAGVRERMYAVCFPNIPRTMEEREAFEAAVQAQYAHDQEAAQIPEGVKSFRIGEFEMDVKDGKSLTGGKICPEAYGLLLRHGLLYRGVEGRRGPC